MSNWDFSGWATKNNVRCSDGRTIMKDAFAHYDGRKVPLLWNHNHEDPHCVLGHAYLQNKDEGLYAYCSFNDTESGELGRKLVQHGDVDSLSIYANHLKEHAKQVIHGEICEVSLVHKGANPEAFIETVMMHGDGDAEELEVRIFTGENIIVHSDTKEDDEKEEDEKLSESEEPVNEDKKEDKEEETEVESDKKELQHADESKEMTVEDVIKTMNEDQQKVMYALIAQAAEDAENKEDDEEDTEMKHNVFENEEMTNSHVLSHSEISAIFADAPKMGSLKDSFLAHTQEYGIEDVDILFPDAQALDNEPQFIQRPTGWVSDVMGTVHHTPFSRTKSVFANITEDEARAKGYIKGNLKKEEVFGLLKREVGPTTVYKKQKLDRDDILDIKDFNVVVWLKKEMRGMLDEECARAILIGDGRSISSPDKIKENCIIPIVNDKDLFVIRWSVAAGSSSDDLAKNMIRASIKARKNYKGVGSPVLFTTEEILTDMLLLEDSIGHRLYKTETELATALRVSKIVTVPVLEGFKDADQKDVYGIIVNMADYNIGMDRGGEVNMFDDFNIDYNQMIYLMETRFSGALTKPFSAIVLRAGDETKSEEPTVAEAITDLAA